MCKYLGQFHLSRDSINGESKTFEHVGIDKRNLNHSMGRNTLVYLHFKASLYVKQPDWNQIPHKKTRLVTNVPQSFATEMVQTSRTRAKPSGRTETTRATRNLPY